MKSAIFLNALLLVLLQTSASANLEDICKQTCENELADFCINKLRSATGSQGADKKGLAAIATDLAVKSFQSTRAKIEALQKNKGSMKEEHEGSLLICTDSYNIALAKLEQVNDMFQKGGFIAATNQLSSALDKTTSCIDAFVKSGVDSLLEKENDEAMNLVHVASRIMETA